MEAHIQTFFNFAVIMRIMPMMTLNHLDKAFGSQVLLDDISLSIGRGVRTGLIGRNGEGKSTLLKIMAGLVEPDSGDVTLRSGTRVAYLPQAPHFDAGFSVFHVVAEGLGSVAATLELYHKTLKKLEHDSSEKLLKEVERLQAELEHAGAWKLHTRIETAISKLKLDADRDVGELSGGWLRRVALARAVVSEPDVLLLDEPFSAIDAHLKTQLVAQLRDTLHDHPRTVLMVTHALDEAREVADHFGIMARGKLVRLGEATDVVNDPRAHEAAVLTGWRNLLAVAWVSKNRLGGKWGALDLNRAASLDAAWVGIRPERIRINAQPGVDLPATVCAVREIGPVREIECVLGDGSRLIIHKAWDAPLPASGTRVGLVLPPEHICLLTQGRAVMPSDGDVATCAGGAPCDAG